MAKIVIIEEHAAVRGLLASICESQGHEVAAFDNAGQGLQAVRDTAPEVLLVDPRSGGHDQPELIASARRSSPRTRCIVVTGGGEMRGVVQAMRRGAFNCVRKPFQVEDITAAVEEALTAPEEPVPVRQKLVIVYPRQAA